MGPLYNDVEHWKNIRINMLRLLADLVPEKFKTNNSNNTNDNNYGKKSKRDCTVM